VVVGVVQVADQAREQLLRDKRAVPRITLQWLAAPSTRWGVAARNGRVLVLALVQVERPAGRGMARLVEKRAAAGLVMIQPRVEQLQTGPAGLLLSHSPPMSLLHLLCIVL